MILVPLFYLTDLRKNWPPVAQVRQIGGTTQGSSAQGAATADDDMAINLRDAWPALRYSEWRETLETLHLWTQIVGKIGLALLPWENHSWHVALHVSSRGLATLPMPLGG